MDAAAHLPRHAEREVRRHCRRSTARELFTLVPLAAIVARPRRLPARRSSTCIEPSLVAIDQIVLTARAAPRGRASRRRLSDRAWTSAPSRACAYFAARAGARGGDPRASSSSTWCVRRQASGSGALALVGVAVALVARCGCSRPARGCRRVRVALRPHDRARRVRASSSSCCFALAALAAVWMSLGSREVRAHQPGRVLRASCSSSALGMFLMASAANLLMAYLSLEFVSLTSYVLTGSLRHNRRSGEAALKYLIYGGVASGAMIYGMSWLFGLTGSMDYAGDQRRRSRSRRARARWRCSSRSCWCSPASATRSRRCRSTCGRPTSTRARRLR